MIVKMSGPLIRQYLVVIAVNLSSFCVGMDLGWTSPVLVKLRNSTESVLSHPITEEEGSWIVAIPNLASLVSFISAYLMDNIGRKHCFILCCMIRILICFLFLFATELWMILVARGIAGFIDMMVLSVVPTYASEVANMQIRGALGTIIHIILSLGVLFMFSIGPFVSYFTLNLMYTCISIVCFIPTLFVPDSPYFLYSKGRKEDSLKVLTYLRGSEDLATNEIKEYNIHDKNLKIKKIELFKNTLFLKSLIVTVIFAVGVQMAGQTVVLFYLQTIMELTGTNLKPEYASLITGFIPVISGFGILLVTDRFGRKPVVTVTFVGAALGLFGLGSFFLLKERNVEIDGFLNYIPILSLILFLFSHGSGFGALFLTVCSELFDGPARGIGMSIVVTISTLVLFIMTRYFAYVVITIGAAATYWTFSVFCVLSCLFVLFCIPETKGRTFVEIQNIMAGSKGNDVSRL